MRQFAGAGYLAGEPPADPLDPDSPDGRFKKLNVPSRGRVMVFLRGTMVCVAQTISASDGTWRIEYLDPEQHFTVIGYDDTGTVNAAIQDWVLPATMP